MTRPLGRPPQPVKFAAFIARSPFTERAVTEAVSGSEARAAFFGQSLLTCRQAAPFYIE